MHSNLEKFSLLYLQYFTFKILNLALYGVIQI